MWKRKSYYVYFFILLWICLLTSHRLICDPHNLIFLTQARNINMTMTTKKNVSYSTADFVFSSYGISINIFTILGWCKISIGDALALFCRNLHCFLVFNFSLAVIYVMKLDTDNTYCSHEFRRCLLLERKVMTNLDSLL